MQPIVRSPSIWPHADKYPELQKFKAPWVLPEPMQTVYAAVPLNEEYSIIKVYYDPNCQRYKDLTNHVVEILGWQN